MVSTAQTPLCPTNKNGPLIGAQAHTNTQAYLNSKSAPPRSHKKIWAALPDHHHPYTWPWTLSLTARARRDTRGGAFQKRCTSKAVRCDRAGAARQVGKPLAQNPELHIWT